jgi:hypothetical protein
VHEKRWHPAALEHFTRVKAGDEPARWSRVFESGIATAWRIRRLLPCWSLSTSMHHLDLSGRRLAQV